MTDETKIKIVISENGGRIEYYFSGPDKRYNGKTLIIHDFEIDEYISAWKNNFKLYENLKRDGKNVTVAGEKNMTVRTFGICEGVCIDRYNMPVKSEKKLNEIIDLYKSAADKINCDKTET